MSSSARITLPNSCKYGQSTSLFINNEFVNGSGSFHYAQACVSPASQYILIHTLILSSCRTEEQILNFPGANPGNIEKAVASARAAFEGPWSEFTAAVREQYLYKLAELIQRDRGVLPAIDTLDNGKLFSAALEEDLEESYQVF